MSGPMWVFAVLGMVAIALLVLVRWLELLVLFVVAVESVVASALLALVVA